MYKSNDSEEIAKLLSSFNYDESKKEEVIICINLMIAKKLQSY